MLAGDVDLNPGQITTIDNNNMWDHFPFGNCDLSIDRTEFKLVLTVITEMVATSGVCLKTVECFLFI